MKRIIPILLLVMFAAGARAQTLTNVIYGNIGDYGLFLQPNVTVAATKLYPNPSFVNNVQIRTAPVASYTDTNGYYSFTNFQAGFYQCDVSGSDAPFYFNVWTNTSGSVPNGSLITNTAASLPDPGTNVYSISQSLALFMRGLVGGANVTVVNNGDGTWTVSSSGGGGGSTSLTNVMWGTTTNQTGAARFAQIYFYFPTNPIYGGTNVPYALVSTN
jgi:hypothetical protein